VSDFLVRAFFGGAFFLVGLAVAILGGTMALTGQTLPGLLGRGRNEADQIRLQRAPASYFRAMGAMALSFGSLFGLLGLVFLTLTTAPSSSYVVALLSLFGLLLAGLIASVVWVFVLSARYKLFRWNKP
jgi:hypothetical protein